MEWLLPTHQLIDYTRSITITIQYHLDKDSNTQPDNTGINPTSPTLRPAPPNQANHHAPSARHRGISRDPLACPAPGLLTAALATYRAVCPLLLFLCFLSFSTLSLLPRIFMWLICYFIELFPFFYYYYLFFPLSVLYELTVVIHLFYFVIFYFVIFLWPFMSSLPTPLSLLQ